MAQRAGLVGACKCDGGRQHQNPTAVLAHRGSSWAQRGKRAQSKPESINRAGGRRCARQQAGKGIGSDSGRRSVGNARSAGSGRAKAGGQFFSLCALMRQTVITRQACGMQVNKQTTTGAAGGGGGCGAAKRRQVWGGRRGEERRAACSGLRWGGVPVERGLQSAKICWSSFHSISDTSAPSQ